MTSPITSRALAAQADLADGMAPIRDRFVVPPGIYLAGNSLGVLPRGVAAAVADTINGAWATDGVASWNNHQWWNLPRRVGDRIGALIGAAPGQVVCGDSTSVQLFQALVGMARAKPRRPVIAVDGGDFPTDRYLADGAARLMGLQVERVDPEFYRPDGQTALVAFSAVNFATGALRDVAGITDAAHAAGSLVCWDLAHAGGALPVDLDGLGADAAVGCTYKFLNGGPGSPAYLYVAARHHDALDLPLTGWQGHATPFGLEEHYRPAKGIERARVGTPPVLSMIAADAALEVWEGVSMADVRAKSLALSDLIVAYIDANLGDLGIEVVTPRDHRRRGSQISLRLDHAYEVTQALIARGVTGDFRSPDIVRLGVTPLYLRYTEVWDAMEALFGVMRTEAWRNPMFAWGSEAVP